jgi:hypothetical protein
MREMSCATALHVTFDYCYLTRPELDRCVQVDRNFALYLPRLAVLVSIAADRPGAWFPGSLGPYQALFPGIDLSRDLKNVRKFQETP